MFSRTALDIWVSTLQSKSGLDLGMNSACYAPLLRLFNPFNVTPMNRNVRFAIKQCPT
jgi:hypothetical protein